MSEEKQVTLPISHFSKSSLILLLRNPLIFKLQYILGVFDFPTSMSGLAGRACHEALKVYYGYHDDVLVPADDPDEARAIAIDYGLKYLDQYPDESIRYGKTGNREAMLKRYMKGMQFYFAEEPTYNSIVLMEKKFNVDITTRYGDAMPLPITVVPDLVDEVEPGVVDVIDTKFTSSFTSHEEEKGTYIIEAMFLKHGVEAHLKKKVRNVIFREIKVTENTRENTGKPQVQDWTVPGDHEAYDIIFYNIFKDACNFIKNPDAIYLPNVSDNMDGDQAWLIYSQGLINADMSDVEVMHKVRDVAFVTKKFLASRLDTADNSNLLPEERIRVRLAEFGIPVVPQETQVGSSVTQYRFKVSAGVRMSTIKKHKDDIAIALQAKGDIRIIAPIPGTSMIGVEVENEARTVAKLGSHDAYTMMSMEIPIGLDLNNKVVKCDITDMPHLLVAGTTGAGKSVFLHSLLKSLTVQMPSNLLKLVLIDPKRVELSSFADSPFLLKPVMYDYDEAMIALYDLTMLMEERYLILQKAKKKDIKAYNKSKRKAGDHLPYIVVVIDEFADFMMRPKATKKNVSQEGARIPDTISAEMLVVRLAQMARAVGIHLVIATQRPSVNVITGVIKANFPTRVAFMTSSSIDSRVILDQSGAEDLVGKGDMLFLDPKVKGLQRLQGFLSN